MDDVIFPMHHLERLCQLDVTGKALFGLWEKLWVKRPTRDGKIRDSSTCWHGSGRKSDDSRILDSTAPDRKRKIMIEQRQYGSNESKSRSVHLRIAVVSKALVASLQNRKDALSYSRHFRLCTPGVTLENVKHRDVLV
jgi:hypothetical protein